MDNKPMALCSRCAEEGKTCCQGTAIFLTAGDVSRIRRVHAEVFWEERRLDADEYGVFSPLDEVWRRIFSNADGVRIIRHNADGDCIFLGAGGCVLDLETRPLVCRLYPYEYNQTTLTGVHGHLCPERNAPLLLALLGMNRDTAEAWRDMLYREIAEEFPIPTQAGKKSLPS